MQILSGRGIYLVIGLRYFPAIGRNRLLHSSDSAGSTPSPRGTTFFVRRVFRSSGTPGKGNQIFQ